MNVKFSALSAGVLFFLGSVVYAQQDTANVKQKDIEEVVVVGYKSKKKDEITQAVSVVSGDELSRLSQSSTSLTNMLQGKASGVVVNGTSGKPGDAGDIRIRGAIVLSGAQSASDPLYVVDGIFMTQRQANAIPASDIESTSILKDAASAAQYGSRGNNGVIVITTKRGKSGKPSVSYETKMGFAFKPDDINYTLMNTEEKIKYENDMRGFGVHSRPLITDQIAAQYLAQSHKWAETILKNSNIQYHNVSLRGGSDKNSYYVSLGYDGDTGILQDYDAFVRHNARFNFDQKVTDKFKIGFDFAVINIKTQDQRFSYNALSPFYALQLLNDYEPIYNTNGSYNPTTGSINPVDQRLNEKSYDRRTRFASSFYGTYEILKGLNFKSSIQGIYDERFNKNVIKKGANIAATYGVPNGQIRDTSTDLFSYVFNNRLDYSKAFGEHKVNATVFAEYSSDEFASLAGTKQVMINANTTDLNSASIAFAATGTTTVTKMISYAALADYNYADRYILSGAVRRDGNSRFGENNKYGDFWGASVAWNLANEPFFNVSFFDAIKFRYSYGTTGNYRTLQDYQNVVNVVPGDYGTYNTAGPSNFIGNADIAWEEKKTQNLGVDLAFWNNRVKLTVEAFKDVRNKFLYPITSTYYEGGGYSTIVNSGDIEVKGIESEINIDILRSNDFAWSVRGNFTSNKYLVKGLNENVKEQLAGTSYVYFKNGEEPYVFKLVRSAGIDPTTGAELFYKADGTITNVYSAGDAQVLSGKSTLPSVFGGFGTTITFKNFDINADFAYQYGAYTYNTAYMNSVNPTRSNQNLSTDAFNYWSGPGDSNAFLPKPSNVGLRTTDKFLQSTDYISFRNLTAGYTFDKAFLGENIPLSSIRIYGSAQNLALWTDYKGDPQVSLGSETQLTSSYVPGEYSLYNYPNVKTFVIGLQVNF